jgi:hypothetical protein
MCAHVDNQQRCSVVNAMFQLSAWRLFHQRRDLHQSTYLYLSEDRDSIFHHDVLRSIHTAIITKV